MNTPTRSLISIHRLATSRPALVVTDDVLVKGFVLGPDAGLDSHEHADRTNGSHVLERSVPVIQDEDDERVGALGVVLNVRGTVHGAHNEANETVIFAVSLCPLPS